MRLFIILTVILLLAGAAGLSYIGYAGESKSVQSTRVGSPGGGYSAAGRVK